jgi:hypothetical protein
MGILCRMVLQQVFHWLLSCHQEVEYSSVGYGSTCKYSTCLHTLTDSNRMSCHV